ncbi:MAG: hypothetical protein PUP93_20375 [Rhizonema sp. NSF051]|nr:hypothetical protein [Rhizonema sp. NSF051]
MPDNPFAIGGERNLLEEWLVSKRNKGTRREYALEQKFHLFH